MARPATVALAVVVAATAAGLAGGDANSSLVASVLSGAAVFNSSATLRRAADGDTAALAVWETRTLVAADDGVRVSPDHAAAAKVPFAVVAELQGLVEAKPGHVSFLSYIGTAGAAFGLRPLVAVDGTLSVEMQPGAFLGEQLTALPFADAESLFVVSLRARQAEALNGTGAIVGVGALFPGARVLRIQPAGRPAGELHVTGLPARTEGGGWQAVQSSYRPGGWFPLLEVQSVSACGAAVGAGQVVRSAVVDPSEPCILVPDTDQRALDERLRQSNGVVRLSLGGGAIVDVNTTARESGLVAPDANASLAGVAVAVDPEDGGWPCVKPAQRGHHIVLGTTFLQGVAVEWDRRTGEVRVLQPEPLPEQPCDWSPHACAAGVSSLLLAECRSAQCEIAFGSPQQCSTVAFGAGISGLVAGVPALVGAAVAWCLVVPALAAARG
ncbi:hypothetical protein FNF27_04439 [Cafeteria roenbergensis]|uniref:Peptidase A1 domain-containing protein n=1 Tax=Cafeteria roenbergensis TaxID=33653 RepID=A0A5A8CSV1_CAFRO|nr:hypothetical protein FNF31_05968 [Cafeteria roenbergensis]KAA0159054.1 hypothetical protein FNF28_05991 [Cafeteria roenbergensis]KAA0174053.1 hypothetical protein FNF27_04439 [Cafeteria roenbergensis]